MTLPSHLLALYSSMTIVYLLFRPRVSYSFATGCKQRQWPLATLKAVSMRTLAGDGDGDGDGSVVYDAELVVKKSKFIALARRFDDFSSASSFITSTKMLHPKASHVAYAYRSDLTTRKSDDGEPSGTAGSPILNAIESNELKEVLCCVVRYYGGTRLGAGGLIRAYGKAARLALDGADKVDVDKLRVLSIRVQMHSVATLYEAAQRFGGKVMEAEQSSGADFSDFCVSVKEESVSDFQNFLLDKTRGSAELLE